MRARDGDERMERDASKECRLLLKSEKLQNPYRSKLNRFTYRARREEGIGKERYRHDARMRTCVYMNKLLSRTWSTMALCVYRTRRDICAVQRYAQSGKSLKALRSCTTLLGSASPLIHFYLITEFFPSLSVFFLFFFFFQIIMLFFYSSNSLSSSP